MRKKCSMSAQRQIIEAALAARTYDEAQAVQKLIVTDIGAEYQRPVTDTWNNLGAMSSTGSFDHKLIENVTNMQDAVVERVAKAHFPDLAAVSYATPHEAATALLGQMGYEEIAEKVCIDFYESDPPARETRRITSVFRDLGCGIEPGYASKSIFALGSPHKSQRHWQQGAFGYGAKSTFRNARAVVLVSRRAPEFEPAEDRIMVAVVLWIPFGKGLAAYYLTTTDWRDGDNRGAGPWSAPASLLPQFEPGTHLALISYGVEGFHRKEGDQRGFDRVLDTRLFKPATPVRFTNYIIKEAHAKNLRGLHRQLEENPRSDRREEQATLPYRIRGKTYHLPVTAYVFMGRAGKTGARRNFVAHDHTVVFTSSGQVHHHWKPPELGVRISLNRLQDRLFTVVETDELPIEIRTELFPATRTGIVPHADALRLEQQVAAMLNDWDFLRDVNSELIQESMMAKSKGRSTLQVARQISRALKVRGYGLSTAHSGNGDGRPRRPRRPVDLYPEPTMLEGPTHVEAGLGEIKSLRYGLNARDEFLNAGHGQLVISCDHSEIGGREITVGQLHNGSVRVMIAVPDEAATGSFTLKAEIDGWQRHSGGFGGHLVWQTKFDVIEQHEITERHPRRPKGQGADTGSDVAVIWEDCDRDGWNPSVPGSFESVPAKDVAKREEYKELARLGDSPVPTIFLNEDYAPLRKYIAARQKVLTTEDGADRARNRYAVGIGVGLALLDQEHKKLAKAGKLVDEEILLGSKRAAAQAALTVLPEFDSLAKEAGIEG
jgi:hypothetical protein